MQTSRQHCRGDSNDRSARLLSDLDDECEGTAHFAILLSLPRSNLVCAEKY
jgi:hypothetical protein